jgi:hypothetical protein
MAFVEFDKYRGLYSWSIMETDRYIFHIEPSNYQDKELLYVLKDADRRYLEISKVLSINNDCVKVNEK